MAHIRTWLATKCSRLAAQNAAQIARIFELESSAERAGRLSLNPLAIPSLLMSAVVICSYTFRSRVCPLCTGSSEPVDLVDLFNADHDCERLTTWLEGGPGLGAWGGNLLFVQLPLCQCGFLDMAAWFRKRLSRDPYAVAELNSFLAELTEQPV